MKLGLAFSGGKDSLACLLLNKERLSEITVFFVNTGKTYPETMKVVDYAKSISPNFVEIKTDQQSQNDQNGLPADVVPVNWTVFGQAQTCKKDVTVQSYFQCCFENLAAPLHNAAKELGITHLIRGQRLDESHRSTSKDGDEVDGIVHLHPIERWSTCDVLDFIAKNMETPAHFNLGHTSLDCFDCTAYQKETKDVSSYRELNHPELHQKYLARKEQLDSVLREALEI